MGVKSRTHFFKQNLRILGFDNALKMTDLMIAEMNAENGFTRHNGDPYYIHLIDSAQFLLNFGVRDEDTITATIGHDYMEDCNVSYDMIASTFNYRVAHYIQMVTKKKEINYKDDQNTFLYLLEISEELPPSLIKTVDRINNIFTLEDADSEKQKRQIHQTETLFFPFFKKCRDTYGEYSHFFHTATSIIYPPLVQMKAKIKQEEELKQQVDKQKQRIAELEALLAAK